MLFPAHVEALRVEMVERVWKESTVVGPLPELMCDIMAYIPKPALTLDCPTDEIIIDIGEDPELIFANGGGVFAIFTRASYLLLKRVFPPGEKITLAPPPGSDNLEAFHVDTSACGLYALYWNAASELLLSEYSLTDGTVCKVSKLPRVLWPAGLPLEVIVVDKHCFLTVRWRTLLEVLHVVLGDGNGCFEVIWSTRITADLELAKERFHLVSRAPLIIDVVYDGERTLRSVRLEMVRESSPFLFKSTAVAESPSEGEKSCLCNTRWRLQSPKFKSEELLEGLEVCMPATDNSGQVYLLRCKGLEAYRGGPEKILFPAHVGALRVEMVERVWKESTVVGPLPELMYDMMAHIPKPALTLDCPMEEILIKDKPAFLFTRKSIVYGIFKRHSSISLEQVSPPAEGVILVRYARPSEWYYNSTCYYDAEASHLYILRYDSGGRYFLE
ncbi:hypothetical protein FOZ61_004275 [Perkinsus olseni]|uniref:Uncharacterized protein n=1 Tax=Perkinsus olseni TaxID=32597 RepID=A0A7J6LLH6_PEROL|nr:hypothetical protein FOZ61_004275 [Perkinsus olseni]KAF4664764.1 hypothetical protein FOL46_004077 [Perkinsus olseni]